MAGHATGCLTGPLRRRHAECACTGQRPPTEARPRGFAITFDGGFPIAARQVSHALAVCPIDAATGAQPWRSHFRAGRDPNEIEVEIVEPRL